MKSFKQHIKENVAVVLARRLMIEIGRRKKAGDKRKTKEIMKDVIRGFANKVKKSEDGPLLGKRKRKW